MRKIPRQFVRFVIFIALINFLYACNNGLRSVKDTESSFAIVVDPLTLEKLDSSITSYKEMLEGEGLNVYLVSDKWESPSEIRDQLHEYYLSEPRLEGAVFIGDVPIPLVMDAQHMTTAYKRDQDRYPLHIAAIPSDRYYDDFDLQFDFISSDSIRTNHYYFSLSADSPQYVRSDIYSGRIKPSLMEGEDTYQLIADYLEKVVSLRNTTEIDFLMSFTGHGYNSQDITAWTGEKMALREQFPSLFTASGRAEFLEYGMDEFMKPYLLGRVQDPSLDIAIFHDHGTPEMQLLNGTPQVSGITASIDNVKRYLRSKLRSAKESGRDLTEAKNYYKNWLDVPDSWFEGSFEKEIMDQDSVYNYNLDIYAEDAHQISPEAKFIMFDACFNGSFHKETYIAGEYVFGKGSVMVAHANSVNVLQDKWPNEMIGLLGLGIRAGNWARQINTMETHLIGDPTFYFKANPEYDYNKLIAAASDKPELWREILYSEIPDLQCLAISNLFNPADKDFSSELRDIYLSSPSFLVRMSALTQLYKYNDDHFKTVVKQAIYDPYELIRRTAVSMIGNCGDNELIDPLLRSIFDDKYSRRVKFNAYNSFDFMDPDALLLAIPQLSQKYSYVLNSSGLRDELMKRANRNKASQQKSYEYVAADTSVMRYRMQEIRILRNYYYHYSVENYLGLVLDPDFDNKLRKSLIEALAWFTNSVHREKIITALEEVQNNNQFTDEVRKEAKHSLKRLRVFM